jgi:hypothetical protein
VTLHDGRLQTLLLARAHATARPSPTAKLAAALLRFAPAMSAPRWREAVDSALAALRREGALDEAGQVRDRDALRARLGVATAPSWAQLTDRLLPAAGLGLPLGDGKPAARLRDRDAWAAAIAARALGLWTHGPPPSLPAFCDQLAWRRLQLGGAAQRLPEAVRALFLQRELGTSAASSVRLVRLLAARELAVPRTELRALRDALVRRWLTAAPLVATAPDAVTISPLHEAPPRATDAGRAAATGAAQEPFAAAVRAAVAGLRDGLFGERKAFIAAAWQALRQRVGWHELDLPTFKAKLLDAHRAGALQLARADLVAAMDPMMVASSEVAGHGATFHFILRETP